MPRFFLPLLLLLLVAGISPNLPAYAQDATESANAENKGPTAIPIEEIPERADADERFAAGVIRLAEQTGPAKQLGAALDSISQSVAGKSQMFTLQQLEQLPVLRLESLERHWKFDGRRFSRWRDGMKQASQPYTSAAAELARRRADWDATRAAHSSGGLADALDDRATTVLAQLNQAEQALSGPLDKLIALGRRANTLESEIQAGQASVGQAIEYIDKRLLHLDSPPLWKVANRTGVEQGAVDNVNSGLGIEANFLKDYSASDLGSQRLLNALQLLLLPLLFWVSYRSRGLASDDPEIQASARVLRRPISAWIMLSMVGVLVFEPDAPLLLHQIALLLALIPVLRLLPASLYRVLGPWPYVATGLYLLERLAFLLLANSFLYRCYYLLLTLLALGLMFWLLWRSRRLAGERINKLVRTAAWAGMALLAVSALCNLFGNFTLAEVLTTAVLDSGYLGLVLYAGYTVLLALLRMLVTLPGVNRLRIVRHHATPVLILFSRLFGIAAVAAWATFTLNRFRIFRPIYDTVVAILTHSFTLGELSLSLGHVLLFIAAVVVAFWAARIVRFMLHEEILPGLSLPRGVNNSIASLSYYAVIILGLLIGLAAAGLKISQLAFVFGALGVGIGFGLQNVVNNFVSGLILMFERPIQPGDVVEVTGTTGKVREIGMRATRLKTFDGADVVVPNGTLLSEKLINWTLMDMNRRIDIDVGVAYGSDPRQVIELLMGIARKHPKVISDPEPQVLFTTFGASSLDFTLRAWTRDYNNWTIIRSEMVCEIHATMAQAGIEIPFPQQDLHLRSISAEAGAMLRPPADHPAPPEV